MDSDNLEQFEYGKFCEAFQTNTFQNELPFFYFLSQDVHGTESPQDSAPYHIWVTQYGLRFLKEKTPEKETINNMPSFWILLHNAS